MEEAEEQLDEEGSDKPEGGKKRKHKGEVEDLFAKLKKQRAAKADKQVRNSVTMTCILQQLCSCRTVRCSISASFPALPFERKISS